MPATVYLVHFDLPYQHARHYVGYTALESVEDRMTRHRAGRGARLLAVVTAAGIGWSIKRLWAFSSIDEARKKERSLKRSGGASRYCPVCRAEKTKRNEL